MVRINTHDIGVAMVGNRKHRTAAYYNADSLMMYSKYFFDRPSGQGFRKGLGITCSKPLNNN